MIPFVMMLSTQAPNVFTQIQQVPLPRIDTTARAYHDSYSRGMCRYVYLQRPSTFRPFTGKPVVLQGFADRSQQRLESAPTTDVEAEVLTQLQTPRLWQHLREQQPSVVVAQLFGRLEIISQLKAVIPPDFALTVLVSTGDEQVDLANLTDAVHYAKDYHVATLNALDDALAVLTCPFATDSDYNEAANALGEVQAYVR